MTNTKTVKITHEVVADCWAAGWIATLGLLAICALCAFLISLVGGA